jgi:glycosyltransferase involved in cell wall biosynthesis
VLTVALDTGPLYGAVTGVGRSVIEILAEFQRRPNDIAILPYAVSFRAPLDKGTQRLAYPAALAIRSWGHCNFPSANRSLRPAHMIHGTNYVVPPSRLPRLVTVHDCWALRHPDQCSPMVNRSMQALRQALSSGAIVHAPSQATAEGVADLFPRATVVVVPWATPRWTSENGQRPQKATWASGTPVIASVGTIDHRKNFVRLITAFAALSHEFNDLVLVLAGAPGNASADVSAALDALPSELRARIFLLGSVDHEQVAWLYQNCSVMAYPSLDEGFGFPILEAMAARVPVVASCTGSLPEIAGTAALLIDPTDTDALVQGLGTALRDDVRRNELIAAGLDRVRQFSWEATAQGLLDLYAFVVETASRSAAKSV